MSAVPARSVDSSHGILLMAYGTPATLDDVEPYFTDIRGGRPPSPESVARLRRRYELVGGRTPLLDITRTLAAKLEHALAARDGVRRRVYAGMKHWHPYIADTLAAAAADGVTRITAIALAPHYSRISIGGYRRAVEAATVTDGTAPEVHMVDRWHQQPEFTDMMATLVRSALGRFDASVRDRVVVVFSAHSLPIRIREWDDPYERELLESSAAVARAVGIRDWRFAWQSAGETGEPWLGPDILEYLETLHAEGATHVLQVPIGFVADHLEVLWDIDVEARTKATALGMVLERTQLPNASDAFVRTLVGVIDAAERTTDGGNSPAAPGAHRAMRAAP